MISMSKSYQTKGGEKVRILCVDAGGAFPVIGLLNGAVVRWTAAGVANTAFLPACYNLEEVPAKRVFYCKYWKNGVVGDLRYCEPPVRNPMDNHLGYLKLTLEGDNLLSVEVIKEH